MIFGVALLMFLSNRKLSLNLLSMVIGCIAKIIQLQLIKMAILITTLNVKFRNNQIIQMFCQGQRRWMNSQNQSLLIIIKIL